MNNTPPATASPSPEGANTHWHCDSCHASGSVTHAGNAGVWEVYGSVTHAGNAGVWEVYTKLMDDHRLTSPTCEGGRYEIRVSLTEADPTPPATSTPSPDVIRIESLRTDYRYLMRKAARETFDKDDAIELIHVCLELARAGWTLTADESDWQPPPADAE